MSDHRRVGLNRRPNHMSTKKKGFKKKGSKRLRVKESERMLHTDAETELMLALLHQVG